MGIITLTRPERKNPLTFDSYAELRDLFRDLPYATDVRAIVLTGAEATSARAATSSRSSSPSRGWRCRNCSRSRG